MKIAILITTLITLAACSTPEQTQQLANTGKAGLNIYLNRQERAKKITPEDAADARALGQLIAPSGK